MDVQIGIIGGGFSMLYQFVVKVQVAVHVYVQLMTQSWMLHQIRRTTFALISQKRGFGQTH